MNPFLQGVLVGLTFAVLLGPAFFTLLKQASIEGFDRAAFLAIGIFVQ